MRVLACPGCGVKIKIPDGKFGRCNCPKCGKALLIKTPGDAADTAAGPGTPSINQPRQHTPTPQPDPLQLPPTQPLPSSYPVLPTAGGYAQRGRPALPGATKSSAATWLTTPLKGFLRRLGIGLAILSGVLLLIGGLGLISEPIAMTACLVGCGAALGLIVWARVWMIVIAFQESITQGLLVLFVPYYWFIYPALRRGQALRPMALFVSALIPALICLAMVAVYMPRYQPGIRFPASPSPSYSRSQLAKIEQQIHESHETSPDAGVLRSVSFPTVSELGGAFDGAKAEEVLAELPGYVPGSFRFDVEGRTVSFQYHGAEDMAPRYGLVMAVKTNIAISVTPTFGDGAMPPKENVVVADKPAGDSSNVTAATPVPAINTAEAVANELNPLQTVSFQTLAQGDVDLAAAEQALAQVNGYVAGSFRFDEQKQLVTLQYRGMESAATQFGFALQRELQMMVRLKPMFAEAP